MTRTIAVGSVGFSTLEIARYNTDGSLDTTFGSSGYVTEAGYGLCAAFDAAGDLIVVGQSTSGHMSVWRFTSSGVLDTTFGLSGQALIGKE